MQALSFGRIATVALFFVLAGPAQAQQCTALGGAFTAEQIVPACTAAIQAGGTPPVTAQLLTLRAYAHEELDKPDLAIADFTAAIALQPTAARYDARCSTRALENQLPEALSDCNEALKMQPGFAEALDSRGFVYLQMGRYDEAIVDFNAALAIVPGYTNSIYSRGIAKIRKGDPVSGLADLAAAKAIELGIGDRFQFYGVSEK